MHIVNPDVAIICSGLCSVLSDIWHLIKKTHSALFQYGENQCEVSTAVAWMDSLKWKNKGLGLIRMVEKVDGMSYLKEQEHWCRGHGRAGKQWRCGSETDRRRQNSVYHTQSTMMVTSGPDTNSDELKLNEMVVRNRTLEIIDSGCWLEIGL